MDGGNYEERDDWGDWIDWSDWDKRQKQQKQQKRDDQDDLLPTQYTLSRIAASILSGNSEITPRLAAKQALDLWFAAGAEIWNERARRFHEEQIQNKKEEEMSREYGHPLGLHPEEESGRSEALNWIEENARSNRDRFKSERALIKAFCELNPRDRPRLLLQDGSLNPSGYITIEELEQFLKIREEKRREASREAKRKQRAKSRTK